MSSPKSPFRVYSPAGKHLIVGPTPTREIEMEKRLRMDKLTVVQLRELAKKRFIKGYSKMKKIDLVNILNGKAVVVSNSPKASSSPKSPKKSETLDKMTIKELKEFAKSFGISIPSIYTKKADILKYVGEQISNPL